MCWHNFEDEEISPIDFAFYSYLINKIRSTAVFFYF